MEVKEPMTPGGTHYTFKSIFNEKGRVSKHENETGEAKETNKTKMRGKGAEGRALSIIDHIRYFEYFESTTS